MTPLFLFGASCAAFGLLFVVLDVVSRHLNRQTDEPKDPAVIRLERKHVWSTQNNAMCGVSLGGWLMILRRVGLYIEWHTYWFRFIFITFMALFNSLLAIPEALLYSDAIDKAKVNQRPVFVVGHPRTGTTHLFNLLSLDERFVYPNTFQTAFASSFLWFEKLGKKLLAGMVSETRPMDNMALSMDSPQEDELALNLLSGGTSYYMATFFMRQERLFRPFNTFRRAPVFEKERWVAAFRHFLKKLTVRAGSAAKRLLLKSPIHAGRIELLLEIFPDAQFIGIHRNPYDVFKSCVNMADTTYWYFYFNTPTDAQVQEFILWQYEDLHEGYVAGKKLVPKGNFTQVSYDEVRRKPIETLRRVYADLGWTDEEFENYRPRLESYLASLENYTPNKFVPLDDEAKKVVQRRWRAAFDHFGYEM